MTISPVTHPAAKSSPPSGRVAVAMSGGVDSSVAAALLVEQGWQVVGIHMKLHDIPDEQKRHKSCCSVDDALDARQACSRLGIPFYVVNHVQAFRTQVIDRFVAAYRQGLTPNPCVMCNDTIKHDLLLKQARQFGCQYLASGHYARLLPHQDGWALAQPQDTRKDQTYFLFTTPRKELPWLRFPLADLQKSQVRQIAQRYGMFSWNKPDSQEICFIPKDYRSFLNQQLAHQPPMPGPLLDLNGKMLGSHPGIAYFTIGQRRGLGIGSQTPLYVVDIHPQRNEVVLGPETALYAEELYAQRLNWVSCSPPTVPLKLSAKIRHGQQPQSAWLTPLAGRRAKVHFDQPIRAITPGQAVAFYQDHLLLGGGWIESPHAPT